MTEKVFDLCVKVLVKIATLFGTDYKTVNVIIFCVIMPVLFIVLLALYYNAKKDVARYKVLYDKFIQDDLKNF